MNVILFDSLRDDLKKLLDSNLFISETLINKILKEVGE
ncbi:hypothetical protein MNB_SV-13-859 [hydrothermal vent metagenome]|uniref:Uncharacterized protein n=1 Tax=hydrothermal vent metagenome TaxID=652676 RepID=A0A1W1D0Y9_9ZZZZ